MLSIVPPTLVKSRPISSLPLARPHFGKYTWASSANRSMTLPPSEVTPPLSKALRYSSHIDLRCSSVIVPVVTVTIVSFLVSRGAVLRLGCLATRTGVRIANPVLFVRTSDQSVSRR